MKTKQISDYHPLPPNHYLPPLALLMEKCYVSMWMCFFPKPCFQEMVENEKLTQAHTYALAGKIALTPFFNHAKFLLLAELPALFSKTLQPQADARQIPGLICREKERPLPPSDQNHLKFEWFHCTIQSPQPLRSPCCKESLNTSHKQTNKKDEPGND